MCIWVILPHPVLAPHASLLTFLSIFSNSLARVQFKSNVRKLASGHSGIRLLTAHPSRLFCLFRNYQSASALETYLKLHNRLNSQELDTGLLNYSDEPAFSRPEIINLLIKVSLPLLQAAVFRDIIKKFADTFCSPDYYTCLLPAQAVYFRPSIDIWVTIFKNNTQLWDPSFLSTKAHQNVTLPLLY